jgi:hypothetical protein
MRSTQSTAASRPESRCATENRIAKALTSGPPHSGSRASTRSRQKPTLARRRATGTASTLPRPSSESNKTVA